MHPWLVMATRPFGEGGSHSYLAGGESPSSGAVVTEKAVAGRELFGGLLRCHRTAANLTQEELAERSGLSVHAISMLERGVRRAPRTNTVELLVSALQLDASQRELLIAAARRQPEPGTPFGQSLPHDGRLPEPQAGATSDPALPLVSCSDGAPRTALRPRRWPPHWWWLAPALPGLLALVLLAALTIVNVGPWRPAPSPSASSVLLCTTSGHPVGCWATITDAGIDRGAPCPHQVPLYVRSGGHVCLARGDLVEITCYYVDGDQFQDHVVAEGAGRLKFIGHIPHRFVNVNSNKPSAVGIRGCLPPSRTAR